MQNKFTLSHDDEINGIRTLPEDLKKQASELIVNRQGTTDRSFMRTESFLGFVAPNKNYQLTLDGMIPISNSLANPLPSPVKPQSTILSGKWKREIDLTADNANILGGNGSYILPKNYKSLDIPIVKTTAEHLAYYNCMLVPIGDTLCFDGEANMPVTITSVGEDYVEDYLLNPLGGGGAYLEIHDRPHFHMPIERNAAGYLIIGKNNDNNLGEVSAFKVPFGYGIYMGKWVIHSDAHLIGRYMVTYSITPSYSTVIVRDQSGKIAKVRFIL
ncbi:MAG: hypothetical protein CMQ51_03775 [Gammaproteobacteria bacterium]|nr:hypothetical protein [Gammaproteobacteria bacterium]|tara:strand:- start:1211 stop:2026 length:816 start_codon:yes stop_codon:yes gene_type:complete